MPFEPVEHDPAILTLTPAEATAKLAEMQAAMHPEPPVAPVSAQGARALLDKLTRDPGWGKALLAGDTEVTKQFNDLTTLSAAGDDVADAVAGVAEQAEPMIEFTINGSLSRRDTATAIADFREQGLNDASITQALEGGAVSIAEHRAAQALQSARKNDPAWVKRLLAGDYEARREHTLMCIILSSPVADQPI
jgi:hypothetical protein